MIDALYNFCEDTEEVEEGQDGQKGIASEELQLDWTKLCDRRGLHHI